MITESVVKTLGDPSLQSLSTVQTRMAVIQFIRSELQSTSSSLLHPVGDLKLSALRRALGEHGISAEFSGGMLVCQSHVIVRTGGSDGQILLEGPLCPDYYSIRDIAYSQYHVC